MKMKTLLQAVVVLALPTAALAAGYYNQYDVAPEIEEVPIPWAAILYALVSLAAIAVVGFKNAKRTHLD